MPHPNATGRAPGDSDKRMLSVSDFCAQYGPGRTFAYELINSGKLRAVKLGGRTLIPRESAEAFVASLPAYAEARAA